MWSPTRILLDKAQQFHSVVYRTAIIGISSLTASASTNVYVDNDDAQGHLGQHRTVAILGKK